MEYGPRGSDLRDAMKYRVDPTSRHPRFVTFSDGGRTAIVMIGPVRGPEHLALIHRFGFYHVPVSAIAASRAAVAFIAFYEGASRFSRRVGMIREYAEVLHVAQVPRKDLPGVTWPGRRGEDAAYYRFDLGPILTLPQTITNPERLRIVFRFPELERLQASRTLRDLGGGAGPASERQQSVRRRSS